MTLKNYEEATHIQKRIEEYKRKIKNIDFLHNRIKQKLEDDPDQSSYTSIQLYEPWKYTPYAEVDTNDLFFFLNAQKERLKLLIKTEEQNFEKL